MLWLNIARSVTKALRQATTSLTPIESLRGSGLPTYSASESSMKTALLQGCTFVHVVCVREKFSAPYDKGRRVFRAIKNRLQSQSVFYLPYFASDLISFLIIFGGFIHMIFIIPSYPFITSLTPATVAPMPAIAAQNWAGITAIINTEPAAISAAPTTIFPAERPWLIQITSH